MAVNSGRSRKSDAYGSRMGQCRKPWTFCLAAWHSQLVAWGTVTKDLGRVDLSPCPRACLLLTVGRHHPSNRYFPDAVGTGGDMAKPGRRPARDLSQQPRQERLRLGQSHAERRHQQGVKVRQRREAGVRAAVHGTMALAVQPGHGDQLRARPGCPSRGRGSRLTGDGRSRE
jgi:hypothetical protein